MKTKCTFKILALLILFSGCARTSKNVEIGKDIIAFAAVEKNQFGLYILDLDDYEYKKVFTAESGDKIDNISISPDKDRIAFSKGDLGDQNIFTIRRNGTALKKLTNETRSELYFGVDDLIWSPYGNIIIFVKGNFNGKGEIYSINTVTGEEKNITNTQENERSISRGEAKDEILFVQSFGIGSAGHGALYKMKTDGTNKQIVINGRDIGLGILSPDNKCLAYIKSHRTDKQGQYSSSLNIRNRTNEDLKFIPWAWMIPVWLGNGNSIAFPMKDKLYKASLSDSEPILVNEAKPIFGSIYWNPIRKEIFFFSNNSLITENGQKIELKFKPDTYSK